MSASEAKRIVAQANEYFADKYFDGVFGFSDGAAASFGANILRGYDPGIKLETAPAAPPVKPPSVVVAVAAPAEDERRVAPKDPRWRERSKERRG